jgi:DNA-binding transcriptional MerR regulator
MNRKKSKGVTIGIVAELLDVSLNTLRVWDKSGKLRANRAKNGYRYYNISEIVKFAEKNKLKITNMKNLP